MSSIALIPSADNPFSPSISGFKNEAGSTFPLWSSVDTDVPGDGVHYIQSYISDGTANISFIASLDGGTLAELNALFQAQAPITAWVNWSVPPIGNCSTHLWYSRGGSTILIAYGGFTSTPGTHSGSLFYYLGLPPDILVPTDYLIISIEDGSSNFLVSGTRVESFRMRVSDQFAATETGFGLDRAYSGGAESDSGVGSDFGVLTARIFATELGHGVIDLSLTTATDQTNSSSQTATGADAASMTAMIYAAETGHGTESPVREIFEFREVIEYGTGQECACLDVDMTVDETGSGSDVSALGGPLAIESGHGVDSGSVEAAISATDAGAAVETDTPGPIAPESGSGTEAGSTAAIVIGADSGSGADDWSTDVATIGVDTSHGVDAGSLAVATSWEELGVGTIAASMSTILTVTETGSGSDGPISRAFPAPDDSGSGTESGIVVAAIVSTDSARGSFVAQLNQSHVAAETGQGSDFPDLFDSTAFIRSAAESGHGVDLAHVCQIGENFAVSTIVPAPETGQGIDLAAIAVVLPVTETGTGTEVATISVSASETGHGSDSPAGAPVAIVAETGRGVDAPYLGMFIGESGSGTDSATAALLGLASDSGSAIDTGLVVSSVPASERGSGAILAALAAVLPFSDSGHGSESAIATAVFSASDVASGSFTAIVGQRSTETGIGTDTASLTIVAQEFGRGRELLFVPEIATPDSITVDLFREPTAQLARGHDTVDLFREPQGSSGQK